MIMTPKAMLVAIAVVASSTAAYANNEVRAVTFSEDAGTTFVHVRGEQTPTFTVYKLERPSRVVIDMPQARLSEALRGHESAATLSPNTWGVSTIAAQQLDDGAVRVIVTLARPGRYDVKTDGNEVIIMVMPRDAAPKTTNPAELEQAKKQTQAAEEARAAAEKSSDVAKAEAERLRKVASEQAARAEAAQRAVEDAKKQAQNNAAKTADLERAKAQALKASVEAEAAKKASAAAQVQAERMRTVAEQARLDALAEAAAAKADAAKVRDEMAKTQQLIAQSKAEAEAAKREAAAAKQQVAMTQAEANAAKKQAAAAQAEAGAAKKQIAAAQAEVERAKQQLSTAQTEADRAKAQNALTKAEAERAKQQIAMSQAEADAAKKQMAATQAQVDAMKSQMATAQSEVERAKQLLATARTEADRAKAQNALTKAEAERAEQQIAMTRAEADAAKKQIALTKAEADAAKTEAQRAKTDAATAQSDAAKAKAEAAQIRRDADADRMAAAAEKQKAEAARSEAEKMMRDAKSQLAQLDKKWLAAQAVEDQARTSLAAAQAREEAARESAAQAAKERQLAEAAAKKAQTARDQSAATDRARLVAEADAAEARLAKAKKATDEAEARRVAAEQAASNAKRDLEQQKTALASTEQQRAQAVAAATDAARKKGEAEAQRQAAIEAAQTAEKQKAAAEQAVADAVEQRMIAELAAKAAEKQRSVAESAAKQAVAAKRDAEVSLADLSQKRQAAERAAEELAARTKAEAKAQAEMIAAKTRKASDDDLAAAKKELAKLTEERKRAETELADRRKAVAQQQTEATQLATAAAQARDAATREEARKNQLAEQRVAEEQELARIKAQKVQAQVQAQVATTPTRTMAPKAVATPNAKVNNITFKGNDAAGTVELAIAGDANISLGEVTASHVELIVDHADLAQKLERTLDVSKFGSPVKKVSSYRDRRTPDRVRLVAELQSAAIPTVVKDGNTVRWRFAQSDVAQAKPMRTQNIPPTVVGGFGAASTPVAQQAVTQVPPAQGGGARGRRIYHGATVEFHFKDAPIHDLLRIIADTGGVNIVVPDSIDAKVTVDMKRVPWDQALDVILKSHGLGYRREGNLYRIAPQKELDAEDEAEAARRAAAVQAEAPKPEVVTLNYASADELKTKLENMKSPKGSIEVDGRTNSLIINDVAGAREQIARLAKYLDTQTPQITIEARIVEARSTYLRELGIQWGGRAVASPAGGNATGLVFPSTVGVVGGNSDSRTNANGITALPSDFAINLPAATGSGEGGAIGLSLGSIGGNFAINLRLSALEDMGTVRIISAPKITVLNNKSALIRQGVSIPISVVSAAGTNTQFVQADLKLEVTPYVSQADCAIAMNIDVSKNEPDFVNVGARGDPTILRKEARTTMLVADGDTSVLGGIYTRNSGLAYKKVPFFADIPVLGWFFKNRRENDDRTEILVFITPKITNKASLRCAQ